jgi:hypothetical protein
VSRHVDSRATLRCVLAQRWCSCCEEPSATGHHVLSRSLGGDDIQANLAAVCGSGTTGCHGLLENADPAARAALGAYLLARRPDTLEYLSDTLGPSAASEWLHRHLHVERDARLHA